MTPERWHRATAIFHAARTRETREREAFLADACQGDASLREMVEGMLAAEKEAGSFGEMPLLASRRVIDSGTRFGAYRIERLIGRGGMGDVYLAHDATLGRDVAIKVLRDAQLVDSAWLERLQREARVLAALNHPNIATIYGIERMNGAYGLVLELVEGPTLADRIAHGPMPLNEALPIAQQIAEALEAAHERGIVHRDIKPSNITFTREGRAKVLDFGLAKIAVVEAGIEQVALQAPTVAMSATHPGLIVGTAEYMSPEQARGQTVDKRTDIWAFGCVLFEMLAGRPPLDGPTVTDILAAIVEREPDWNVLPATVPSRLHQLLRQCLAKDVRRRLRDIGDARLQMDALTSPENTAEPRASGRRLWSLTWLVGIAVAIVAAALTANLVRRPSLPPPVYRQVTFRRGTASFAQFAPDGQTIIYSARWEGQPTQLFSTRIDRPESALLPFDGFNLLSISRSGRVAIRRGLRGSPGQLAEMSLGGQAARPLLNDINWADWDPSGEQLAVTHVVNGRTRLEYPPGTVLYDSPRVIGSPRFSPKGGLIAFIDVSGGGSQPGGGLSRIDVVDLKGHVRIVSDGWSEAFTLAWAPDGDEIWFSARSAVDPPGGPAIHAVTLSGRQRLVLRTPGVLLIRQIWSDGRVLLNHESWPSTMMCKGRDDGAERDVTWLDFSNARALSTDGRSVLFDEGGVGEGSKGGVYMRSFDGSPAVRLGDGAAFALSPDGTLAVVQHRDSPDRLQIVPTGAGQLRTLDGAGRTYLDAKWFPNGTRLLVTARDPGQVPALFTQDVNGGAPRKIVDGVGNGAISPDGRLVASIDSAGSLVLTPVDGGSGLARTIGRMPPGTSVLGWSSADTQLFLKADGVPAKIFRANITSGRSELWRTLAPSDLSGLIGIQSIAMSADGQSYCYSTLRNLSTLFVVEGLR